MSNTPPRPHGELVDFEGNVIVDLDAEQARADALAAQAQFLQADRQDVKAVVSKVKSGYTGHVPGAREEIGGSYRDLKGPGMGGTHLTKANMAGYGKSTQAAPTPEKTLTYEEKMARATPDMLNALSPPRVEKILSGSTAGTNSQKQIPSGYAGHVPKAAQIVGTSYFGPVSGAAYRGPGHPEGC